MILSIVAGGLGRHLRGLGHPTGDLELIAMVPVSVRSEEAHGALGNQVSAMMAPLPVWSEDPVERLHLMTERMGDLKHSKQAVGANLLSELTDFAPTTIASQAARLQSRQRFFNLVVTNVPGPQFPLYVLGRQMRDLFPMVPLAKNQGMCVGIMSYDGGINFGLIGDYEAMPTLDGFAADLQVAMDDLAETAGEAPAKPEDADEAGRQARRVRDRLRRLRRPAGSSPRSHRPITQPVGSRRVLIVSMVAVAFAAVAAPAIAGLGPNPANDSRLLNKPIEGFDYDEAKRCSGKHGVPDGLEGDGGLARSSHER